MPARRLFAIVLTAGVTLDLLSFIGWSEPTWTTTLILLLLVPVAIGAFVNLRVGVAAILLELVWGGHGYLLRVPAGGLDLSLRTCLFLVVLIATIWHVRTSEQRNALWNLLRSHPARWPALVLLATLVLGGVLGMLRHPFDRAFFDANAWGFLLLTPAFLLVVSAERQPTDKTTRPFIILAGAAYLILRTYVLLFLFSHDLGGTWMPLYQWIRDTRLGEVTIFPGAFPRIFLPSMILLFPALLLAGSRMMRISPHKGEGSRVLAAAVFGGSIAVLIVSLSRSYWLALLILGVIVIVWAAWSWWNSRHAPIHTNRSMAGVAMWAIGSAVTMLLLAIAVVRLPYPRLLTTAGLGETFAARFQQDAAVGNRWQELRPLRDAIMQHPILGNGFGAAVTYETKDPRTLSAYPDGKYTTTAFEWGYLDDLLERGLVGLLAELWLIGALIWHGIRRGGATTAFALGLLAIAIVHGTSPYLNHPLGIGVVLWLFVVSAAQPLELLVTKSLKPAHV